MTSLKVIATADGSHTLRNEDLAETYHSSHGAIQESKHVFIANGFEFYVSHGTPVEVSILEIGFGTGLNALLTLQRAIENQINVKYTSIEPFPVPAEVWRQLNYAQLLGLTDAYEKLHQSSWDLPAEIHPHFHLQKRKTALEDITSFSTDFDIVYYDAFSPAKQPSLWTLAVLEKVVTALKDGGMFVTYCAKGALKRNLKALGLVTESLPGPPGKREMVRATKSVARSD